MAKTEVATAEIAPSRAAVVQELDRIAASVSFRKATQCVKLLRHLTTVGLDGDSNGLKEYSLGVAVFDRPASYDPRIDPIVRLEARRLRLKLAEYYREEGAADDVIIDLPKGAYIPDFRLRISEAPPAPVVPAKWNFKPWLAPALAIIAVLAAAGYAVTAKRAAAVPPSPLIAVIGFKNLTAGPETSWVASAVSELLNIELPANRQMRAVPLDNVARMRTELSVAPQAVYNAATLEQIRANLGVDFVVTGTYTDDGRRVHFDLTLYDARLGRQVAAFGEDATEDHLAELTQRFASHIRSQLGVRLAGVEYVAPRLDAAAMEPYARGMERLRESDALNARKYLEQAAAADPSNPLIHSGLSAAWTMLGLDARAKREAQLAFDSSAALSRVEQLEIEGRYRALAHEWPRALQVYQALVTLLPEDLEYGLLLAWVESEGGRAQDVPATVARLRALPAPLSDDPRIDLAEARAAGALSDFEHTRQAAQSAAKKAKAHRARLQYAKATLLEAGAMQNLGLAGYAQLREEARNICAELGDRACVAAAFRMEGNNKLADSKLEDARRLYQSALEIASDIGSLNEQLNILTGLGYAALLEGDLKTAESSDREAHQISTEMGPQKSYSTGLNLAEVLTAEGRLKEARPLIDEARTITRRMGEKEGIGLGDAALAHLLACEGKLPDAILEYREALRTLREVNEPEALRQTLLDLGNVQLDEGDSSGARQSFEEARDLTKKYRPAPSAAQVDMGFARLSFQENRWAEARQHAAAALDAFTAAGRKGDQYEAAAMLSRALLKEGDVGSAATLLARYPAPDSAALPVWTVVRFQIAQGFLLANTGKPAEALRTMNGISPHGFPLLEKEVLTAREALARTHMITTASYN